MTTLLAVPLALMIAGQTPGQTPGQSPGASMELKPGLYTVTVDSAPVHSGASSDNYAFLLASKGSTIRVVDTLSGWARVPAQGPLFQGAWGWVRYPSDEPGRFEVGADGTGTTYGRTDIYAPNLERDSFTNSYRWICTLPAGAEVRVLESTTVDAETTSSGQYAAHRVLLPSTAEGWVNASVLRPATDAEIVAFRGGAVESVVARDTMMPPTTRDDSWILTQPSSPIADWSTWASTRGSWTAARNAAREAALAAAEAAQLAAEIAAAQEAQRDAREAEIAAAKAATEAYRNKRWMQLEATVTATPLYRLDAAAVDRLRAGYITVIDEESQVHPKIAELATIRLRQLDLAKQINATRTDIETARARIDRTDGELDAARRIIDDSPEYVLRGRLTISTVFDGIDRPIYYRLQDPFSGRSLAYVSPDSGVDLRGMLGQRVGIVGRLKWNQDWHITMVEPQRVDLVSVSPTP